jgi:large subunit ribosomal protein L15
MKVHELRPPAGSTRARRRVGRGIGGKGGKTAGRGTKGQGARDTIPMGFEGGQLPLMQRIPKLRGFKNPFRIDYTPVNVGALQDVEGDTIGIATLVANGLARKGDLVKILGGGELSRPVTVEAHAFSKSAEAAIAAAGGSTTVVPLPFGHNRPPAQGNALTNR